MNLTYYIIMFVCVLLVPLTMVIFGAIFMASPPREVNEYYGYRTRRSMSSREAWNAAHRYFGRLWLIIGAVLTPICIAIMLAIGGLDDRMVDFFSIVLVILESLVMLVPIFPTEAMLKRRFGE